MVDQAWLQTGISVMQLLKEEHMDSHKLEATHLPTGSLLWP